MPKRTPKKRRFSYKYPRPMVTVDGICLRLHGKTLETLLIRRKSAPHKGKWALPGGFIRMNEPLEKSVIRELGEETGLREIAYLTQLGTYGDPKRDPRGRVLTVAFLALIADDASQLTAGSDAADAAWYPVEALPEKLAFDHPAIIGDALRRLLAGARTSAVLLPLLPDPFTEQQAADALQAVYGVALDPRQYLARLLESKLVQRMRGGKRYRFAAWREDAGA